MRLECIVGYIVTAPSTVDFLETVRGNKAGVQWRLWVADAYAVLLIDGVEAAQ